MVLVSVRAPSTLEEKYMKNNYQDDITEVQRRARNLSDETNWLAEVYNRASAYHPDLANDLHKTSRVLAWLGLAEPNKDADYGCEGSGLLVYRIAYRGLKD
jgi:hypothetical protein